MKFPEFNLNDLNADNIGDWPKPVKIAILIFVFIVLVFLGYRLDISSKLSELDQKQSEEKKLQDSYAIKSNLSSNLNQYRDQLKQVKARFQSLLMQLPTQTEVPGLLEDISKTGIANGLEFTYFKPQPEVVHDFYAELPIDISVKGDFHHIALFISQITALNRIVTLHDFNLALPKEDNSTKNKNASDNKQNNTNSNILILDIKAKTYRYTGQG